MPEQDFPFLDELFTSGGYDAATGLHWDDGEEDLQADFAEFDPALHPRGQPGNRGKFAKKGAGGGTGTPQEGGSATAPSLREAVHDYIRENGAASHGELVEHLIDQGLSRDKAALVVQDLHETGHLHRGPDEFGREDTYHVPEQGASAPKPEPASLPVFDAALARAAPRVRAQMGEAVRQVSQRLSPKARERVQKNVKEVRFHDSCLEMAELLRTTVPELASKAEQQNAETAGGCYVGAEYQQLHVVSGYLGVTSALRGLIPPEQGKVDSHMLAHELGHVLDGPTQELSRSVAWTHAWAQEIGKPGFLGLGRAKEAPLTEYARTNRHEGFAEFSRMLHASAVPREQIEKQFPRCVAYWKEHGLWE